MNIYLMQHGKPVSKEENPDKPLSNQGKEDAERAASFLLKAGIRVDDFFHSGKTRARQTAEILISKLTPGRDPVEKKGISPLDDVKRIAGEIKQGRKDIMLVGHLPHLAKLTSFLITGDDSQSIASFQQGGILCLRCEDEEKKWTIAWMLVPEIVR